MWTEQTPVMVTYCHHLKLILFMVQENTRAILILVLLSMHRTRKKKETTANGSQKSCCVPTHKKTTVGWLRRNVTHERKGSLFYFVFAVHDTSRWKIPTTRHFLFSRSSVITFNNTVLHQDGECPFCQVTRTLFVKSLLTHTRLNTGSSSLPRCACSHCQPG